MGGGKKRFTPAGSEIIVAAPFGDLARKIHSGAGFIPNSGGVFRKKKTKKFGDSPPSVSQSRPTGTNSVDASLNGRNEKRKQKKENHFIRGRGKKDQLFPQPRIGFLRGIKIRAKQSPKKPRPAFSRQFLRLFPCGGTCPTRQAFGRDWQKFRRTRASMLKVGGRITFMSSDLTGTNHA